MESLVMASTQRSKVKYSPQEERLLRLLPTGDKRIISKDMVEKFYTDDNRPYHDYDSLMKVMRGLRKKVEYNKEPFKVIKDNVGYAKVDR